MNACATAAMLFGTAACDAKGSLGTAGAIGVLLGGNAAPPVAAPTVVVAAPPIAAVPVAAAAPEASAQQAASARATGGTTRPAYIAPERVRLPGGAVCTGDPLSPFCP